ncbi:MAG: cache domain-containing protein [Actinomycetota bacterium]
MKVIKYIVAGLAALLLVTAPLSSACAEDFGTREQAKAMVEKAAAFYKANGKDKALAEFSNPKGMFVDRDLYVISYALDGVRLSHPYNPKLVGKSAAEAVDFDGKPYGKEIIEVANTKGSGWVDYKFTDPTTKKLSDKTTYVLKAGDIILACGVYKH